MFFNKLTKIIYNYLSVFRADGFWMKLNRPNWFKLVLESHNQRIFRFANFILVTPCINNQVFWNGLMRDYEGVVSNSIKG